VKSSQSKSAESPPKKKSGNSSDTKNLNNLKILAVDDEEIMGYLLKRIVRHWGSSVDWVTSFETALDKIENENYDLILSDFKMPRMNGETFYNEICIRKKHLTKKMIFITGDTVSTKTIKFLERIKAPYLTKPFHIEELKKTIIQMTT